MIFKEFSALVDEIIELGYDKATAARYAGIIGDRPQHDAEGNVVVAEKGKVLARLQLTRFSKS